MSRKYKFYEKDGVYFERFTTFSRHELQTRASRGEVQSKTLNKEIYIQGAKAGDAKKVSYENLETGTCTEDYQECK